MRSLFRAIESGDLEDFEAIVAPDYLNHQTATEPLATRRLGPASALATALWLRRAFAEMHFEVERVLIEGDWVAARVTAHGRHAGPFVVHDSPDGRVTDVFPPTGRQTAIHHTHWFRIADGRIAEHDADRDDLGMARQAGWIPPSPSYLVRMLIARRRERAAADSSRR